MDDNTITGEVKKKGWSFKIIMFWILAFLITASSAYYQRITGPTYPTSGVISFQGKDIKYKLDRSCDTSKNVTVKLENIDPTITGIVEYKRYNANDDKTLVEMKNDNGTLKAEFPTEKDRIYRIPAQKFEYHVILVKDNQKTELPSKPVVLRFKGDVPLFILLIHILVIFSAMLVSTRAGFEFLNNDPDYKKFAFWTLGIITLGGLVLGPVVQKFAFGEFWTGIPFGFDLTDNKTLIAWVAWLVAAIACFRSKNPGRWILGAALVTLIVFSIPHSVLSGNTPGK